MELRVRSLQGEMVELGCSIHTGRPQLWRRVQKGSIVQNTQKRSTKDAAGYAEEGDAALTPWEVMDIRSSLMSTNGLYELQLWTMTLLGIKLFLREYELGSLRVKDILLPLSCISAEGSVKGLCVKILVCLHLPYAY